MCTDEGPFQNGHWPLPQQISKRVCRNLSEFCSPSSPEPNLDLWVLRMLGLKDVDTIDPSPGGSCSLNSLVKASSSKSPLDWFGSSSKDLCRTSTYQHSPAKPPQNCSASSGPHPDFTVPESYRLSEARTTSSCPAPGSHSPPEEPGFRWTLTRPGAGPSATWSSGEPGACWLSLNRPSPDWDHSSPLVSPSSSSRPHMKEQWRCSPGRPSGGCWVPAEGPADVVFSMSLSPSCSVRTHSFPQGQAFVRKNPEGRWNFTWVPTQGP